MKRILLLLGVISLFVWVVWPFLRGGQSTIQTAFMPINTQMEALLGQAVSEKQEKAAQATAAVAAIKATTTPKASQTPPKESPPSTATSEKQIISTEGGNTTADSRAGLLNLNTATLEQLDKLPGIGESKAKAIIAHRSKIGSFKRVEELMDVKGIGEKMFEKLRGLLFVAPS
ncbi:helix-hairpin-helix domain-containing protein [Paenibacillus qinlingensis]|nr:helix-hairpin-helix domain-containing protein [Paenibacillus qinlingensis]